MSQTIYAVGSPGEVPRYSTNPLFAVAGPGEHRVELAEQPAREMLMAPDGERLVPSGAPGPDPWDAVRLTRNTLLDANRWTVMPDSPLSTASQADWLLYLRALQRITLDYADPDLVEWPELPSLAYPA